MAAIKRFRGINNVTDPVRMGAEWLTRAENVNVTETGGIARRQGFTRVLPAEGRSAYATLDQHHLYLQDGSALLSVLPNLSTVPLVQGLSGAPLSFTELNGQVYFSDPAGDAGIVLPDGRVLPWRWEVPPQPQARVGPGALPAGLYRVAYAAVLDDGRETGLGPALELDLPAASMLHLANIPPRTVVYIGAADSTVFQRAGALTDGGAFSWDGGPDSLGVESFAGWASPLPQGATAITAQAGRIFAALPMPEHDQSVVWASLPMAPHLWKLERDYFMVPGEVLMLAPAADALLVGAEHAVYLYTPADRRLRELAPYGVVPGHAWAQEPAGRTYFWTQRGLCAFPDFENLTERQVSVPPGVHAAAALVHDEGQMRFVAALQRGGTAFNPWN